MQLPVPAFLAIALIAACGGDSQPAGPPTLETRIEGAIAERLAAARGPDWGAVLTDDTPRADVAEPREGVRPVFLRGACFHVPLTGLIGVTVGMKEGVLEVGLAYEQGSVQILDRSGDPEDREIERLRRVGHGSWEEIWKETEREFNGVEGAADALARWRQILSSWDAALERRLDTPLQLRRAALQAEARASADDPEDLYRACRLLSVKSEMIASLGGEPDGTYAVAAGPTIGLRRGRPGADAEIRTALFGPDRMSIAVLASGALPGPLLGEILDSFRPFAESRVLARRLVARADSPVDAALAALSALHLDPSVENCVQLLRTLSTLQAQRRELAAGMCGWIGADEAGRQSILAAAD